MKQHSDYFSVEIIENNPEMEEFIEYCMDFYGDGGVYDMGATRDQVIRATANYLIDPHVPFTGDSLDREQVRGVLEHHFGLEEKALVA